MKRLLSFLTLAAIATAFSIPTAAQADEQGEIIYRARGGKNIFRTAETAAQRIRRSTYRAPIRAQYDDYVNRKEGLATAREEDTTWVLSLYCDLENLSTITAGHALAD